MKRFLPTVVWFVSGAVIGEIADTLLFGLWSRLGLLTPVAHWLQSRGYETLADYWGVVWLHLVSWLVVVVAGMLAGLFLRRRLVLDLIAFGIGFAFVPLAISAYFYSYVPSIHSWIYHVAVVVVLITCGVLSQKLIRGKEHEKAV